MFSPLQTVLLAALCSLVWTTEHLEPADPAYPAAEPADPAPPAAEAAGAAPPAAEAAGPAPPAAEAAGAAPPAAEAAGPVPHAPVSHISPAPAVSSRLVDELAAACLRASHSVPCGQEGTCCSSGQQCRSGVCREGHCAGCTAHAQCPEQHFCFRPGPDSESLCLKRSPLGTVCETGDWCASGVCCDHVCQPSCYLTLPNGAHCTASSQCRGRHCNPQTHRCTLRQLTLLSRRASTRTSCPSPFTECGGNCYLLQRPTTTWLDALHDCARRGAPLALPRSYYENQCVEHASLGLDVWMAMEDNEQEGTFVPADGRGPADYFRWTPDNPDNYDGDQNCVQMWNSKELGGWDDDQCYKHKAYVCQKSPE